MQHMTETMLNGPLTKSGAVKSPEWQILKDLVEDNVDHVVSEQSSSPYVYCRDRLSKF